MARHYLEYHDSLVNRAVAKGKITQDDADLIKDYMADQSMNGCSALTRFNVFYHLVELRQYIGEYRCNTDRDLYEGIKKFKESERKLLTVMNYLTSLKQFYLWLVENGYSSIARDTLVHKMKIKNPDSTAITADPILTKVDVTQLIEACKNNRDRAFVALLYDAGIKTKEACRLTWRQCKFDKRGLYLTASENAKFSRHICCAMAADFLSAWRNEYPGNAEGENLIFVTRAGDPFTHQLALRLLGKIVKESGIKKPVHLHLLQHGRAKHLGPDGTEERAIKKMLWRGQFKNEHQVDFELDQNPVKERYQRKDDAK